MRFTWNPEYSTWVGEVGNVGPAGTSALSLYGVSVEFDRLDSHIVSLLVTVDDTTFNDELIAVGATGEELLGDAWWEFMPPAQQSEFRKDVDLSQTDLFVGAREFARAAQLAEDARRLEARHETNSAAIAYAELAQVLHDLQGLAAHPAEQVLERVVELLADGPPLIYAGGVTEWTDLVELLVAWAPGPLAERMRALANPVTVPPRPQLESPEPGGAAGTPERGTGPVTTLARIRVANALGREALRREQSPASEPERADQAWRDCAQAWRDCAQAWLELRETGRAALALDRAGFAATRGGDEVAGQDLARARELGPAWTRALLGGSTGEPHRPLWWFAPDFTEPVPIVTADGQARQPLTQQATPGVATPPVDDRAAAIVGQGVPPRDDRFIGREDLLQQLQDRLSHDSFAAVTAVRGVGGVGKTRLAAEYLHRHRDEYELIGWIDAERPELIAEQLAALAPAVGVADSPANALTAHAVVDALNQGRRNWLLVFDNAAGPEGLREWLPQTRAGHLIVTSRAAGWEPRARVSVDVMSQGEAVLLLKERSGGIQDETAGQIAQLLSRLPLAVVQAGGHLSVTGMPADEYLRLLHTSHQHLREAGRPDDEELTIATVWDVSRTSLGLDSPAALHLLRLCAFLGPEPIPAEIFTLYPDALPPSLADAARDSARFARTTGTLLDRGLIRRSTEGLLVHRVLASAIRRPLAEPERAEAAARVQALLHRYMPKKLDRPVRDLAIWRRLLPHVLAVTDSVRSGGEPGTWLLDRAGTYLHSQGLPSFARPMFERALTIDEDVRDNHSAVARDLTNLALVLKDLNQPRQAQPLLTRALDIDQQAHGRDNPAVAADLTNLAAVLYDLDELRQTVPLLEEARRIDELGQDPDLTVVLNNLSKVRKELDQSADQARNPLTRVSYGGDPGQAVAAVKVARGGFPTAQSKPQWPKPTLNNLVKNVTNAWVRSGTAPGWPTVFLKGLTVRRHRSAASHDA